MWVLGHLGVFLLRCHLREHRLRQLTLSRRERVSGAQHTAALEVDDAPDPDVEVSQTLVHHPHVLHGGLKLHVSTDSVAEPPTSGDPGSPVFFVHPVSACAPAQKDRVEAGEWAREDLNLRPHAYQACALTKLSYEPSHIGTRWAPLGAPSLPFPPGCFKAVQSKH